MPGRRSFHRWTEEEREIMREYWPKAHEQFVLERLGSKMTLCAVRYQAQRMGLKKGPERWHGRACNIGLNELRVRLLEAMTINKILQDRIKSLEAQLRHVSARAYSR